MEMLILSTRQRFLACNNSSEIRDRLGSIHYFTIHGRRCVGIEVASSILPGSISARFQKNAFGTNFIHDGTKKIHCICFILYRIGFRPTPYYRCVTSSSTKMGKSYHMYALSQAKKPQTSLQKKLRYLFPFFFQQVPIYISSTTTATAHNAIIEVTIIMIPIIRTIKIIMDANVRIREGGGGGASSSSVLLLLLIIIIIALAIAVVVHLEIIVRRERGGYLNVDVGDGGDACSSLRMIGRWFVFFGGDNDSSSLPCSRIWYVLWRCGSCSFRRSFQGRWILRSTTKFAPLATTRHDGSLLRWRTVLRIPLPIRSRRTAYHALHLGGVVAVTTRLTFPASVLAPMMFASVVVVRVHHHQGSIQFAPSGGG
mmetsp:Transcript_39733/g.83530  ORF Transcript_39733/g.83530 Transcript_39733/m.83530 type:complete len:369 (+) Transcript_39733:62-1168(+)